MMDGRGHDYDHGRGKVGHGPSLAIHPKKNGWFFRARCWYGLAFGIQVLNMVNECLCIFSGKRDIIWSCAEPPIV